MAKRKRSRKKTSKRRSRKKSTARKSNRIPLHILKRRLVKLSKIVKARS